MYLYDSYIYNFIKAGGNMENTKQNQENQEQTSNHNEVDNRYKENLEKLKKGIEEIEEYKYTSENEKEELLSREFSTFISDNFPENKELTGFIDIISKTIKKYQKFACSSAICFTI